MSSGQQPFDPGQPLVELSVTSRRAAPLTPSLLPFCRA